MTAEDDSGGRTSWAQVLSKLADALVTLARAEVGSLRDDLRTGSSELLRVAFLVTTAAFASLLGVAGLLYGAGIALALVVPAWLAAVLLGVALLVIGALLGSAAARRWRDWEPPWQTFERRATEHLSWVQSELLAEPLEETPADVADDQSTTDQPI